MLETAAHVGFVANGRAKQAEAGEAIYGQSYGFRDDCCLAPDHVMWLFGNSVFGTDEVLEDHSIVYFWSRVYRINNNWRAYMIPFWVYDARVEQAGSSSQMQGIQ